MSRHRTSWQEAVRAVGRSAAEVAQAELALLSLDYKRWGKRFGIAVGLFLTVAMIGFWLVALLIYIAVRLVEHQFSLTPWLAALAVAGGVLLIMLVLAGSGYGLMRSLDDPIRASRRRYGEHVAWWRASVLGESPLEDDRYEDGSYPETGARHPEDRAG